jgi:dimethylaniline monooxygenase (N-oxide forming)
MRLAPGARVAVVGAGPSGLLAAKHALAAGFDPTVFEAGDDVGGQWHTRAAYSGVWPGMRTNTSRGMTAFADFPPPIDWPLHPTAEQVHDYLRDYATRFGVTPAVRLNTPVKRIDLGWTVDREPFDAVVVASGRFRRPRLPAELRAFQGELLHAFDYPGADAFHGRRTLVYGNGVSGNEIASDIATVAPVVSAFRKPRYILQKVVDDVPSDWQWYSHFTALQRSRLPPATFSAQLRARVLRVAGNPVDFGALEPDEDLAVAGHSLAQNYLRQVADGHISCRPSITSVDGCRVAFADGSSKEFDVVVSATGYELDLPFLSDEVRSLLGPDLVLYQHTLPAALPTLGFVGQFSAQGPYFPLLELQARWIVAIWSGEVEAPGEQLMRSVGARTRPTVVPHDALALALEGEMGITPDLRARPELAEALLFGPLLPARHRLDGPGAMPDAAARFAQQLSLSPRAVIDPADLNALRDLGLADVADLLEGTVQTGAATNQEVP